MIIFIPLAFHFWKNSILTRFNLLFLLIFILVFKFITFSETIKYILKIQRTAACLLILNQSLPKISFKFIKIRNFLFNSHTSNKPIHIHNPLLSNPMRSINGLQINHGIPIIFIKNNNISSGQIKPKPSHSHSQQHQMYLLSIGIKLLHNLGCFRNSNMGSKTK